jgi:hypothetical protein
MMRTLDFYLSQNGISQFSTWYLNINILESIYDELDNYVLMLKSTRWLDESPREQINQSIREYLELFIQLTFKKPSLEIYTEWLDFINKYCFQGGYGYAFSYPDAPHHWVIRPEHYFRIASIPEEVSISACINNKYIEIARIPEWENWSG